MDGDDHRKCGDAQLACGILILFLAAIVVVLFVAFLRCVSEPDSAASRTPVQDDGNGAALSLLPMPGNPFVPGM